MMKSSINKLLDKMNELQHEERHLGEKSWEKYQAGNEKASKYYDHKQEVILGQIKGIEIAFKTLGLNVWVDKDGVWSIPLDDIERVC